MGKTEDQCRQEIVDVGRLIYQKGWVAANDGNLSVRLDGDRILCTPTAMSKGMMQVNDLIVVDFDGNRVSGCRERTTEIAMHLAIYQGRGDVGAVVHVHPPFATGFAAAGRALDLALLPEVVVALGMVPLAPYGLPGTPALTESIRPFIPHYDAILLQNHGATSYGADLYQAFFKMETVEHFARITLFAELLGGAKPLGRRDVEDLIASRKRYGVPPRPGQESCGPLTAEDFASSPQHSEIQSKPGPVS